MSHLLAYCPHRDTILYKLRGSTLAALMDGRLDPGATTILLPSFVHHGVVKRKRASSIAGIATKDGARGDMTVLEIAAQKTNTLWGSRQHHGMFTLSFPKHSQLLVVLGERHI